MVARDRVELATKLNQNGDFHLRDQSAFAQSLVK
ncbi:MAG: hypothetical protein ACJA2E_002407 [Arenicella sp.]|jgi:hypothetical protein